MKFLGFLGWFLAVAGVGALVVSPAATASQLTFGPQTSSFLYAEGISSPDFINLCGGIELCRAGLSDQLRKPLGHKLCGV